MAKPKDVIRQIKKATRRQFSAEEKIRIVLEGLRGETSGKSRTVHTRETNTAPVYYIRKIATPQPYLLYRKGRVNCFLFTSYSQSPICPYLFAYHRPLSSTFGSKESTTRSTRTL